MKTTWNATPSVWLGGAGLALALLAPVEAARGMWAFPSGVRANPVVDADGRRRGLELRAFDSAYRVWRTNTVTFASTSALGDSGANWSSLVSASESVAAWTAEERGGGDEASGDCVVGFAAFDAARGLWRVASVSYLAAPLGATVGHHWHARLAVREGVVAWVAEAWDAGERLSLDTEVGFATLDARTGEWRHSTVRYAHQPTASDSPRRWREVLTLDRGAVAWVAQSLGPRPVGATEVEVGYSVYDSVGGKWRTDRAPYAYNGRHGWTLSALSWNDGVLTWTAGTSAWRSVRVARRYDPVAGAWESHPKSEGRPVLKKPTAMTSVSPLASPRGRGASASPTTLPAAE